MLVVFDEKTFDRPCSGKTREIPAAKNPAFLKRRFSLAQEVPGRADVFLLDDFLFSYTVGILRGMLLAPSCFAEKNPTVSGGGVNNGSRNISLTAKFSRGSHDDVLVFCERVEVPGHFFAEFARITIRFNDQEEIHVTELIGITPAQGAEKNDGLRVIGFEKGVLQIRSKPYLFLCHRHEGLKPTSAVRRATSFAIFAALVVFTT